MGGQDGSRGYLIQAIIAVLDSLTREDWEFVSLEPDTDQEKVDILWEHQSGTEIIYQVKSSKNNFEKSGIIKILEDLVRGSRNAEHYKLVLIGPASRDTTTFINNFPNKSSSEFDDELLSENIKKIEVKLTTLDISALDSQIQNRLHAFFSNKGFLINHSLIQNIGLALSAQFLRFGTEGKKVSKSEFENNILEWCNYNFPKVMLKEASNLSLGLYVDNQIHKSKVNNPKTEVFEISTTPYFRKRKEDLIRLIKQIESIKLPKTIPDFEEDFGNPFSLHALWGPYDRNTPILSDEDIEVLNEKSSRILDIETNPDFFNIGQVKNADISVMVVLGDSPRYIGTEKEVEKRSLLDTFKHKLNVLDELLACWTTLNDYKKLPIVIINEGNQLHTNCELHLLIPSEISVIHSETFPSLNYNPNMELLSYKEGFAQSMLAIEQNSKVKAYDNRNIAPQEMPFYDPIFGKEHSEFQRLFKASKKWLFDYEIYQDEPSMQTLICTFKNVKPGDAMALPSYLLIKSSLPFELTYFIKTDQTARIDGKLIVS